MKKVEAYQTSDGKKFLKKSAAESHEDRLRYKSKVGNIRDYLYRLLGIKDAENLLDDSAEEQLSTMLMGKGISGIWEEAIELDVIIELITDIATIADGALLKAAQYAKEITSPGKKNRGNKKIEKIMDILLEYNCDISNGYDFDEDVEDMLKPIAERVLKVAS